MPKQVGGDHYEAEYQHWDWAIDIRLGYLESAATKYIFRWYKKAGLQDLEKGLSYVVKLREAYRENRVANYCWAVSQFEGSRQKAREHFRQWVASAKVPQQEEHLCELISQWRYDSHLATIEGLLRAHIKAVQGQLANGGTLGPLLPLGATSAAQGRAAAPYRQGPRATVAERPGTSYKNPKSVGWDPVDHPSPFGYDEEQDK